MLRHALLLDLVVDYVSASLDGERSATLKTLETLRSVGNCLLQMLSLIFCINLHGPKLHQFVICAHWKPFLPQIDLNKISHSKHKMAAMSVGGFFCSQCCSSLFVHLLMDTTNVCSQISHLNTNLSCIRHRNKVDYINEVHPINDLKWTLLGCPILGLIINELCM